jgi:hypothetical protein
MKKIPYGISSYEKIKADNYYYIDKTKYIEIIENYGSTYHFFLRPRRFGKSLFISMLQHYYDIKAKDQFNELFGDTYIGKNPTPLRNTFPVLRFNFSMVKTFGKIEDIELSFSQYIFDSLRNFVNRYNDLFHLSEIIVNDLLTTYSGNTDVIRSLFMLLSEQRIKVYVIIDEYDNFANNILTEHGEETYTKVTHAGGFLRNFFTNLKGLTDNREIDRLFITGVSPLVMADVTSGFNIGDNISQDPQLSAMVGITNEEAKQMLDYYNSFGIFSQSLDSILDDFNLWYNGYSFNQALERVYNTISVLYYVNQYIKTKNRPVILTDENMRTDYGKFRFLLTENNKINGNFSILREIAENNETTGNFVRSFALKELIDTDKFKSLLFYLGFTSIKETDIFGIYVYTVPNKLIKIMIWEFIQKSVNEVYNLRMNIDFFAGAFLKMATKGEWQPVLKYIIEKFYEAVSVRDFVFHEEGIKTFILAWLNLGIMYKTYSERELNQGYADIYMEPEKRYGSEIKYGYIMELKYIKSAFLKTKAKAGPEIQRAIEAATAQLNQYLPYNNCTTTKIIIVASAKKLLYMDVIRSSA